jgi:peptidoglycan/LPS O-acetylase OafA/YrhL
MMKYRREIDGLRALAILPVMLFHAGFKAFSGGFVGVDIFFVISGYLVTSVILTELKAGQFSILCFFERRIRRIVPALFLVMACCIPFSLLWLIPNSEMKDFARSLVAAAYFTSNILYWTESGYFDAASELKPLLHTWSLSVEGQYYLLFPLCLMALWRLNTSHIIAILTGIAILSFMVAQWGSVLKPSATFYLLPTRAWELLIGSLVALYLYKQPCYRFSNPLSELAGATGLFLIIFSIFFFSKETPTPSLYTLVPTVGTALILLFTTQETVIGRIVGCKPLVAFGLLSYSAYLWHHPIFAYARHLGLSESDFIEFIALTLLSLGLSYLSYKFVELPFRGQKTISRNRVFALASISVVFFTTFGSFTYIKKGDLGQMSTEKLKFLTNFENSLPSWSYFEKTGIPEKYRDDCNFYDVQKYRFNTATKEAVGSISSSCYLPSKGSDRQVFIWGDSHAQQLYYGLRTALPSAFDVLQVASSGCMAKLDAAQNKLDYCEYSNWFALNKIKEIKPKFVVVGQLLQHNIATMKKISTVLLEAGVEHVFFTGPSPQWSPTLPSVIATKLLPEPPHRTYIGVVKDVLAFDYKLKRDFFADPNVTYVSLIDYFCTQEGCVVYYGDDVVTGVTTWDSGHLAPIASLRFAADILAPLLLR